ncbi:MAG: hypothetical protein IJT70_00175, partial [Clostridia bacterium]|nr:hypothetical protein [Clostridia bacterium]
INSMEKCGAVPDTRRVPDIYSAPLGCGKQAFALVQELRANGIYAETDVCSRSLKAQMKYADKLGAKYTLVLGENEIAADQCSVKDMAGGGTVRCRVNTGEIIKAIM